MRALAAGLGLLALLVLTGCSDRDPVSSSADDGTGTPAQKLVVSGTRAGGHPGASRLKAVHQGMIKAANAQDIERWLSYCTDEIEWDYVPLPPPIPKDALPVFWGAVYQAFPDMHLSSQRILTSRNILVEEQLMTGTLLGQWGDFPPTGKAFELMHLVIHAFDGDKVNRYTTYVDYVGALVQVGLMPAPDLPPLAPSFALPDPAPTGWSPRKAALEVVSRWSDHDLNGVAEMIHPEAELFMAPLGAPIDLGTWIAVSELYFLAFPDIRHEGVRFLDLGDGWVVYEVVSKGVNDGPYFGIPATGKAHEVRLVHLMRVNAEGIITVLRSYWDELTLMIQLGLVPTP